MDEGLKQRLIGALVVLALGVIFLPLLFEPDQGGNLDRTTQIPPAPAIEPVQIELPQANDAIEPAKSFDEMYVLSSDGRANAEAKRTAGDSKEATEAPAAAPATSILDAKGVARAWALQIGSFSEEDRAVALRDQLIKDGYPAYARSKNSDNGRMTRVYIGPKVDRSRAIELKRELDRKLKLDTLIVIFTP